MQMMGGMMRPMGVTNTVGGVSRESAQATSIAKWEADEPLGKVDESF